MTFTTHDAQKHHLALVFGRALFAARKRKGIGKLAIARQTGISRNALTEYERGRILPRFTNACRIADAVGDEDLVRIARELRTLPCATCTKPFINDGQGNTRYCSPSCHNVKEKQRLGRPVRVLAVRMERQLDQHRVAVAAMCGECEPSGACRTPDCPLRLVSPLPLVEIREPEARALPGRWGSGSRMDGSPIAKAAAI
jgi:transcriptional regulator with XRE-family HTH domain